jgi:hypothetical protein
MSTAKDDKNLEADFAETPWGLGQSFSSCSIESGCARPNCNDLGNQISTAKGAAAYMVMLAMTNVNQVYEIFQTGTNRF